MVDPLPEHPENWNYVLVLGYCEGKAVVIVGYDNMSVNDEQRMMCEL